MKRSARPGVLTAFALGIAATAGSATIVVNDSGDILHNPGCATTGTGTCTLRDALTFANANAGPDTITFNIPGAGVQLIQPDSALPDVTDDALTIDGYTQPGASPNTLERGDDAVLLIQVDGTLIPSGGPGMLDVRSSNNLVRGLVMTHYIIGAPISVDGGSGNVIVGNFLGTDPTGMNAAPSRSGIVVNVTGSDTIGGGSPADRNVIVGGDLRAVDLSGGTTLKGNYIGTNKDGTAALGGTSDGVGTTGPGNVIGGSGPGEGNLISGNGMDGVSLSSNNSVVGNAIGTDRDGVLPIPNGADGVGVVSGESMTVIAGNTIAFNAGAGVHIGGISSTKNRISQNSIWGNGGIGIELGSGVVANDPGDPDVGPNMLQNYPVPASAVSDGVQTTVAGLLNSLASTSFVLEFFASPACDSSGNGPGKTFLGSTTVTTDASFNASFVVVLPRSAPGVLTATATDPNGNTSEFSPCVPIVFGVVSGQPPLGPEFQVNTYTTGMQYRLAVAENWSGSFVVAWSSYGQDGSGFGVYAQRYGADGAPQGGEFQVNTYTTGHQMDPSLAMDTAGNFVVAWRGDLEDGDGFGIFGQRFDASGSKLGGEFQINTFTTGNQSGPSVGMTPAGDFVVAWFSDGVDGSNYGITARRFDSSGNALGPEFQVNTYTTGDQDGPSVGVAPSGSFVIVWQSAFQDGSFGGVYGQRYDASGAPLGGEFLVNEVTTGGQGTPSIAVNADDSFVVAWSGMGNGSVGIFARRFDSSGTPLGHQFPVSTSAAGSPTFSKIGADDMGNFVVTWHAYVDPDNSSSVFGRTFRASGAPAGPVFPINVYTTGAQEEAWVAVNGDGNFVVAWRSQGQDGDNYGVFARRGQARAAQPMQVDAAGAGASSNGNGVLDPGETVTVDPAWRNTGLAPLALNGTASDLSGPPGPTYTLDHAAADYGSINPGFTNDCAGATGDCYQMTVAGARPSQHWDATFNETLTDGFVKPWTLHIGGSFDDALPSDPFYFFIENLFHNGVTGGCGGGNYCPGQSALRNQMAVFVLKAREGSGYVPPPAVGIFTDVPASDPFAPWIEELHNRGVVAGCGPGPTYCPTSPVLRQQMSVFLLKTLLGSGYAPPACIGVFADVPCSNPFAPWIEDLAARGITSGCGGGNFCPDNPTTRGQMAVFLTRTFGLLLYGP
jgi:hypothetical protein